MVKAGHWSFSGKAEKGAGGRNPSEKHKSEDLRKRILRLLRVMGDAFVAEKRLRHPFWVPQYFIFRRNVKMKKLLAILLTLAMVFSLSACSFAAVKQEESIPEKETQALKSFTVTVVHADGTQKEFSYETDEKYVGSVLEKAGLIKGENGPYGMMVTQVDGEVIEDTNKAYWAIYEGEEYAMQGIDTTPVKDGQVYKLVYTLV